MQSLYTLRNIRRLAASSIQRQYYCLFSAPKTAHRYARAGNPLQGPQTKSNRNSQGLSTSQKLNQQNASTAGSKKICWRCHKESDPSSIFCENEKCSAIQPVGKNTTYYGILLRTEPTFDVDVADLRRRFLKLQQGVHPDSYSQKEDIERKLAETQSSWINHAYATLKDPLLRARYLLKLQGSAITEEDKITDPELLMEIMEMREDIEEARTEDQIASIKKKNDVSISAVVDNISQAFKTGELDHAKQLTNQFQYLRRVSQAISTWEPGKAIVVDS